MLRARWLLFNRGFSTFGLLQDLLVFVAHYSVRLTVKFLAFVNEDLLTHSLVLVDRVLVEFSAAGTALDQVLRSLEGFRTEVGAEISSSSVFNGRYYLAIDFVFERFCSASCVIALLLLCSSLLLRILRLPFLAGVRWFRAVKVVVCSRGRALTLWWRLASLVLAFFELML